MRISDWSSDVCSSDLDLGRFAVCLARGNIALVQGGTQSLLAVEGQAVIDLARATIVDHPVDMIASAAKALCFPDPAPRHVVKDAKMVLRERVVVLGRTALLKLFKAVGDNGHDIARTQMSNWQFVGGIGLERAVDKLGRSNFE